MGVVYKAEDLRLKRQVALKFLPEELANDRQALERFQREAQTASALNHPNICTIFDIGEEGGKRFIAMELLEGRTLKCEIQGRALEPERLLDLAIQISDGLAVAHSQGIVHRDIKPSNIFVSGQQVKILDFGLAKAKLAMAGSAAAGLSFPTASLESEQLTSPGAVIGTVAYMSPEQAHGNSLDARSDIFSFGLVLYEMATGRMAFAVGSIAATFDFILNRAPASASALNPQLPAKLVAIIEKAIEKDRELRYQSVAELRADLKRLRRDLRDGSAAATPALAAAAPGVKGAPPAARQRWLNWATGLLAGALLTGVASWWLYRPAPMPAMHFRVITNFAGAQEFPALSPDGRSIAFVANRDGAYNVYVGVIGGGNLVEITHDAQLKSRPAWTPDGESIAYGRLNASGLWDIWKVPALGGTPRRLVQNADDPAWSPHGQRLAYVRASDGSLWIASATGEDARQVLANTSILKFIQGPRFSPDGKKLAFILHDSGPYSALNVLDLATGKLKSLTHQSLALWPAWSPDGRTIYFASSRSGAMNIWKIGAQGGRPIQITAGQGDDSELDVSADGKKIVFSTFRENINIAQIDLVKHAKTETRLLTNDPVRDQLAPAYSPGGRRLAYFTNLKGVELESIWDANADGSLPVPLVQDQAADVLPQWTPDGKNLIYTANPFSKLGAIASVPVSGGAPQLLLQHTPMWANVDIGRDGRILFADLSGQLYAFDPRTRQARSFGVIPGAEHWTSFLWSPDERSVAFIRESEYDGDPRAGVWVETPPAAPRQILQTWVVWITHGPGATIYALAGRPNLIARIWKLAWAGGPSRKLPLTLPMVNSYYMQIGENSQNFFSVSPRGNTLAFNMESVYSANIGMIEMKR